MTLLTELYFNWIIHKVVPDEDDINRYSVLFHELLRTEFYAIIDRDGNRASDGLDLRNQFLAEYDETLTSMSPDDAYRVYDEYLGLRNCSVLEVMVALALRVESTIMYDPDSGDRSSIWFMDMVRSLRLENMTNGNFNYIYFKECMNNFLNRNYEYNGYGSLFTVYNPKQDMRNTEIWYQCMRYLDNVVNSINI